jgi:hypothetical protein
MDELPQSIYTPLDKTPTVPAGYLLNFLSPRLRDDIQQCPRDIVESIQRKQDVLQDEIVGLIQQRVEQLFEFSQRKVLQHKLELQQEQLHKHRDEEVKAPQVAVEQPRPRKSSLARSRSESRQSQSKRVEFDLKPEVNVYAASAVDSDSGEDEGCEESNVRAEEQEQVPEAEKEVPLLPPPESWTPLPVLDMAAGKTTDAGERPSLESEPPEVPASVEEKSSHDTVSIVSPPQLATNAPGIDDDHDDDRLFEFDENLAKEEMLEREKQNLVALPETPHTDHADSVEARTSEASDDGHAEGATTVAVSTYASSLPIEISLNVHMTSKDQELDEEQLEDEELVRTLSRDIGRMSFSQRMIWERATHKS